MYVSNFVKKTPNYCRHISNCHVICARLHTTCNDPTEMLQLNERPVTRLLYSDAARVTWTSYRQIWRRLRGNWAREVKPLMRQGKHSSDVCLPLPNVRATSGQHFTITPCTSPVTLFSMYNVMVVSQFSQSPSQ